MRQRKVHCIGTGSYLNAVALELAASKPPLSQPSLTNIGAFLGREMGEGGQGAEWGRGWAFQVAGQSGEVGGGSSLLLTCIGYSTSQPASQPACSSSVSEMHCQKMKCSLLHVCSEANPIKFIGAYF